VWVLIFVRTQCEPMRPHLCHRLSDSVLFEFGTVPESRVNRGSGFLRGGEVYLGGRGMLGRV